MNDPGAAAQFLKLLTGANVDVTLVITPAPNMPLASLLWSLFSMFDGYTINGDDNVLAADVISNFKCLCYTGARGDWLASIEHKWAPTTSLDAILSALQSFCGAMHTGGSLSVLLKSAPLLALALLRHAHVAIEKCPFASERARLLHCYLAVVSACGPLLAYDAILLDVMTTLFAVAKLDGGMLRDQAVFAAVGLCESVVPLAAGPDFDALLERCLFDLFAMASDAYTLAAQDPTSDGSMLVSDFIGLLARAASTPSFQQAAATLSTNLIMCYSSNADTAPPAALRRHPAFEALAPTRALLPAPLHIGYIIQQNRPCGASDLADLRVLLSVRGPFCVVVLTQNLETFDCTFATVRPCAVPCASRRRHTRRSAAPASAPAWRPADEPWVGRPAARAVQRDERGDDEAQRHPALPVGGLWCIGHWLRPDYQGRGALPDQHLPHARPRAHPSRGRVHGGAA